MIHAKNRTNRQKCCTTEISTAPTAGQSEIEHWADMYGTYTHYLTVQQTKNRHFSLNRIRRRMPFIILLAFHSTLKRKAIEITHAIHLLSMCLQYHAYKCNQELDNGNIFDDLSCFPCVFFSPYYPFGTKTRRRRKKAQCQNEQHYPKTLQFQSEINVESNFIHMKEEKKLIIYRSPSRRNILFTVSCMQTTQFKFSRNFCFLSLYNSI